MTPEQEDTAIEQVVSGMSTEDRMEFLMKTVVASRNLSLIHI